MKTGSSGEAIQPVIRPGRIADLADLLRIYNHYVCNSHVTFDTGPLEAADRRGWIESFSTQGPHRLFVAEAPGRVLGYACSTPLRPKPAYDTSVETTVYVDPACTGRGLGRRLYTSLMEALQRESVHRAYGIIALPNGASVSLHESLGFMHVGTLSEAGYKFGRYRDIALFERRFRGGPPGETC